MGSAAQRLNYLAMMGIEVWERRASAVAFANHGELIFSPQITSIDRVVSTGIAAMDWAALEQAVNSCTACQLHHTRIHSVFGIGNQAAPWLIIGDAPSEDADQQLLNQMLNAIGLGREEVYIAYVIKSRQPGNRNPFPDEIATCLPYLKRQIELVRPKIILVTGQVAAQNLLATTMQIGLLRGRVYRYGAPRVPLIVTYHPSYLLRSSHEKRKAWDDLRLAWRVFHNVPPDGQNI